MEPALSLQSNSIAAAIQISLALPIPVATPFSDRPLHRRCLLQEQKTVGSISCDRTHLVALVLKFDNNPALASKFFHWAGKQKGYSHNFAAYNALAYCLNRNNAFRAADQVPQLMESQGKPTEKKFEILIRMHSDCNGGFRVVYVHQKMKKFGLVSRIFLYNRIMDALVRTSYLGLALSVYEDFKGLGFVEKSISYMILIKGFCKAGRIKEMLEILGKMKEN